MNIKSWDKKARSKTDTTTNEFLITSNDDILIFYKDQIAKYGCSSKALTYPSDELYQKKLSQYGSILKPIVKSTQKLLDVGCGYGSLLSVFENCLYQGIDIVPEFITEARKRFPAFNFSLLDVHDVESRFDWVVGLGIMGLIPNPIHTLNHLWCIAERGMIIDFIDSRRYNESLNTYNIEECTKMLIDWGANRIKIHSIEGCSWVVFEVSK